MVRTRVLQIKHYLKNDCSTWYHGTTGTHRGAIPLVLEYVHMYHIYVTRCTHVLLVPYGTMVRVYVHVQTEHSLKNNLYHDSTRVRTVHVYHVPLVLLQIAFEIMFVYCNTHVPTLGPRGTSGDRHPKTSRSGG
jgi:hypothetical protein